MRYFKVMSLLCFILITGCAGRKVMKDCEPIAETQGNYFSCVEP